MLGLLHVQHRNRLHHQIPDGLLMFRIFEIIGIRIHIPETGGNRDGGCRRLCGDFGRNFRNSS